MFLLLLLCISQLAFCRSLYDVLGVSIYADQKEIKKAYYHLALTLHPDKIKNPTEEDKNRYMEIVKAYETLSDPEKKRLYDLSGDDNDDIIITNAYTDQPFEFKSFSSNYRFEAIFTPHHLAEAPSITIFFPITLTELFTGISHRTLKFNRTSICPICHGTGADSVEHTHTCDGCQGSGLRSFPSITSPTAGHSFTTLCDLCHGSGYQARETPCSRCHGLGITTLEDAVDLSLSPGIRSTHQVYFRGLGHEQFKRRRGDVIVKLQVQPHPLFDVEEYTLHMNVTLSIMEALIGFDRQVLLPTNETIVVKKNTRTADHSTMILQNQGVPRGSSGVRGSLILHFRICYPYLLTREEMRVIQHHFGPESNDLIDYIHYQADLRLRRDSDELGYALSFEEFLYSSQSSVSRTCLCAIPFSLV